LPIVPRSRNERIRQVEEELGKLENQDPREEFSVATTVPPFPSKAEFQEEEGDEEFDLGHERGGVKNGVVPCQGHFSKREGKWIYAISELS
jgi:hypothetical protein